MDKMACFFFVANVRCLEIAFLDRMDTGLKEGAVARPSPMRRGLKLGFDGVKNNTSNKVARPSPMRRGLKLRYEVWMLE